MRQYKTIIALVYLIHLGLMAQTNPVVSNVTFAQRADGSLKVDIYYDVYDADGDTLYVTLQASADNGATWALPVSNVTGAVGGNILSGINKQIVWEFGREKPNFFSDQVKVKVMATDIKCNGLMVEYGGKTYNTVQIGSQCWLKENLDIGVMIQGTQNATNNGVIEKYCYNNDTANCTIYGGLYQWNEAMQYVTSAGARGICPIGWHLPTYEEFQTLSVSVNGNGNALKAVGQGTGGGSGTNTSGFSALLTGSRYDINNGVFYDLGGATDFWSSIEDNISTQARSLNLYHDEIPVQIVQPIKSRGNSLRCLKD